MFIKEISTFFARKLSIKSKIRLKKIFKRSDYPNYKKFKKKYIKANLGKVLFFTSSGIHRTGNLVESMLAKFLKNSGSNVYHYSCNGVLNFCNAAEYENTNYKLYENGGASSSGLCQSCILNGNQYWENSGILDFKIKFSNDINIRSKTILKNISNIEDIINFKYDDINIGEHAKSSALRYLCTGDVKDEYYNLFINYLKVNLKLYLYLKSHLKSFNYVFCFHGIYTPHGILSDVCKKLKIPLITWNTSYRKSRFLFTWGETYHKKFIYINKNQWYKKLNEESEKNILNYIESRSTGKNDWQQFNPNSSKDISQYENLNWNNTFLLLPNVVWDAQLFFPDNFYDSMIEWVFHSIDIFINKPNLNLIIRIHPAEIKRFSSSRQPLYDEIISRFKKLPNNIIIIKNNDKVETSLLAKKSKAILIYGSKAGIEFSSLGKRVIVCGESWVRNKNFTIDPNSKIEYEELFDNVNKNIPKMTKNEIKLAVCFADYFFNRSALFIPEITSDISNIGLIPDKKVFYESSPSHGLKTLINFIVNKKDFAYD